MKTTIFKKIIPALLIVMILSVGIFGAVGVEIAQATHTSNPCDHLYYVFANPIECPWSVITSWFKNSLYDKVLEVLAIGGNIVMGFFGMILGIAGGLLNLAVKFTVLQMGTNVRDITAITEGWKMFRDLANIIIIFALLVIGIATILRIEQYGIKKLLGVLIVVALLINFSMFFTKVVIDSSNLLASQFYKMAETEGKKASTGNWTGIADSYKQALRLPTIYNSNADSGDTLTVTLKKLGLEWYQIILITMLGSILFIIAAFALFAGAFLLIIRYVALIFLIILSPLAFVGMILPKTQNLASKWWGALFSYSFFAPIFLLLTWFTIKLINSSAFKAGVGISEIDAYTGLVKGGAEAVKTIPLFLNFAIAIGFIIGSLILAKQMGGYGSSAVMSWGHSARKWGQGVVGGATLGMGGRIMRNTVGRGASKMADSEKLKTRAAGGGVKGIFGRMQLRGLRGVAGSSFDARATKVGGAIAGAASLGKAGGKGGYEEKLKQQVKAREKFAGSLVESKKSQTERIEEQNIRDNIKKATKSLDLAEERLNDAKIRYGENSQQAIDAKRDFDLAKQNKDTQDDTLRSTETGRLKRGLDRQQKYADTLETEKILGIPFLKVARKGKESSDAIRKSMKDFKKKKNLKDLASAIIEEGDSAGAGGVPPTGGPAGGGGTSGTTQTP